MAKGGRRSYARDSRGRFSSSGTTRSGSRPAPRPAPRGRNRLTRDNAGRITSVGGDGATARGGRLRTASGKLRATQTAKIKSFTMRPGKPRGTGRLGAVTPPPSLAKKGVIRSPKSAKPQPQAGPKRKVTVQIKRAAPGGEYGPDGHFYSGGSWMPLGGFKGGAKAAGAGKGAAVAASQSKSGGQGAQERVIRQAKKERPRLDPGGTPIPIPGNISKRGQKNIDDYYKNGYFKAYKEDRDGRLTFTKGGWSEAAANASRLTPKQTGAAIARLRKMARDKKDFDAQLAWDRTLSRQPGSFGYEEARRGGYLPRGMTKNQFHRSSQLEQAIGLIASQRAKRNNNRRSPSEEYIWVKNNMLGTRPSRAPKSAKAKPIEARANRIRRAAKIPNTTRPVSTKRLVAAGGNRWQKGAHDRVYFNVSSSGKIFYDRNTRKMNVQGYDGVAALKREARRLQKAGRRTVPQRWKRGRIPND